MFESISSFMVLYTENVLATKDFYTKIGAEINEFEEDKVVVILADYNLHFVKATSEPFAEYEYVTKKPYGLGVLLYIGSEDLEDAQTQIKNAGSSKMTEIKENEWDSREFLFEDNNGYKFVVYELEA
jgi:predicted enzyme related to lactoylglutathione lyase